jgi:hypothetical protein
MTQIIYILELTTLTKVQFWPSFLRDRRFILPTSFAIHADSTIFIGPYTTHVSEICKLLYYKMTGHNKHDPVTGQVRWDDRNEVIILRLGY